MTLKVLVLVQFSQSIELNSNSVKTIKPSFEIE